MSEFSEGSGRDPGIVIYLGNAVSELRWLYRKALTDIVTIDIVKKLATKLGIEVLVNGHGIIGATASIGALIDEDCTYELLAYRDPRNYFKRRVIDPNSVIRLDRELRHTFNNYDYEVGKVLITPGGFDPVLFGVRGDDPEELLRAIEIIKCGEEVRGWVIFRTNQGTNAHLVRRSISSLRPYMTALIRGKVVKAPKVVKGGEVFIHVNDGTGTLRVCFFKELGRVNQVARRLIIGDEVVVGGSVKLWDDGILTLHAELLEVVKVGELVIFKNPKCPRCGATLKSSGKGKGFKCVKCGFRSKELSKVPRLVKRDLKPGIYVPPPRAQKHLQKPLKRYGKEKVCSYVRPIPNFIR